ncbi:hypothetical protein CR513_21601, partial [Mucuna pruriens]
MHRHITSIITHTPNKNALGDQKGQAICVAAPYAMRSKTKAMKNKNQDLKGEVSQLKEKMAQMFQILSHNNATITTVANQGAMGYAQPDCANEPPPHSARDPPYGMPYGWRTKAPTIEEHEQQNVMNNEGPKVVLNIASEAGPSHGEGT